MKKLNMLLLLLLMAAGAYAQSDSVALKTIAKDSLVLKQVDKDSLAMKADSEITSGIAQDEVTAEPKAGQKIVNYDIEPMQIENSDRESIMYSKTNRNTLRYFGSPFADHFLEVPFAFSAEDIGIGLSYTYLPEVWGANITGLVSVDGRWLMAGTAYRLSDPWTRVDWHAYANLGFCHHRFVFDSYHFTPALAAGFRCSNKGIFRISTLSATVGAMTNFEHIYFTLGINILWW